MTGRVLIVDDIIANVRLLEARLLSEYFEVVTASSGAEALELLADDAFDIILLDVMMPEMDGFEVCRRIKDDPKTAHIPVVMVTALDQPDDRVKGLEAGADDFLTKPVNDISLTTRVKNLIRLKRLHDEFRMRASTGRVMGFEDGIDLASLLSQKKSRILVIDERRSSYERSVATLSRESHVDVETEAQSAQIRLVEGDYDLAIIAMDIKGFDPLRLCAQIRSFDKTRILPIMLICEEQDNDRLMKALELGVNDYVVRPVDRNELLARTRTQIRRKRFNDTLRDSVQETMELAIKDGLTGLYNRRYLESHLTLLTQEASQRRSALSLIVLDVDHFKHVNDTYGHHVGDEVLKDMARRLRRNTRGLDLLCRYGGEEFVIAMPETAANLAFGAADRIREKIATEPFVVSGGMHSLDITISIGVASFAIGQNDTSDDLFRRADKALYQAKLGGRNKVVLDPQAEQGAAF